MKGQTGLSTAHHSTKQIQFDYISFHKRKLLRAKVLIDRKIGAYDDDYADGDEKSINNTQI